MRKLNWPNIAAWATVVVVGIPAVATVAFVVVAIIHDAIVIASW